MDQIIIDLQNSSNARVFKDLNVIHKSAFESVESLLLDFQREHLERSDDKGTLTYKHNTITILGTRGSGKTSFLLSIEEVIKNDKNKYGNLLFLEMIDPTLVEEKGHIFLNVISVICEKVKMELEAKETKVPNNTQCIRKEWKESLNKLAKGLPVIDGIGGNKFGEWQDAEFVMNNELQAINSARNLAKCFAEFIKHSLKILDKKQFVLFFDDIDVDSTKGYAVLETIRKYFISDQIITFLSGDLKLYDALVREKKWSNFGTNLINYEVSLSYQSEEKQKVNMMHYNDMVTDLTSQYLIKIMQPKYRIHLSTLYEYYRKNQSKISVSKYTTDKKDTEIIELKEFLKGIFKVYGIKSNLQRTTFVEFLLKQSLRTVMHFLQYFSDDLNVKHTDFVSMFLSDLYEKKVNIDALQNSVTFFIPTILQVLLSDKKLKESYQLIPSTLDNSFNASVFTGSLLFSYHVNENHKFLIFEYFFKIAYIRNFIEKEQDYLTLESIIKSSGLLSDHVFRDSCNQLQSSLFGKYGAVKEVGELGLLQLYGLAKIGKKNKSEKRFRLDYVIENTIGNNQLKVSLSYLPSFIAQSSTKNAGNLFYSVISLFSSLGELTKRYDDESLTESNFLSVLGELSQVRYYSTSENEEVSKKFVVEKEIKKKNESNSIGKSDSNDEDDETVDDQNLDADTDVTVVKEFFDYLRSWFEIRCDSVSPFLLGKIFTRFYYSLNGIANDNSNSLGQSFNLQIIAFFNAVIIEEARELELDVRLNNDNIVSTDKIFIDNMSKVTDLNQRGEMKLSSWLLSCPILQLYVRNRIVLKINSFVRDTDFDQCNISQDVYKKYNIVTTLEKVYLEGGRDIREKIDNYEDLFQTIRAGLISNKNYEKYDKAAYREPLIKSFFDEFSELPIGSTKLENPRDFIKYCVKRCKDDILDKIDEDAVVEELPINEDTVSKQNVREEDKESDDTDKRGKEEK